MRKNFLHAQFYQLHLKKICSFIFYQLYLTKKYFFQIISVIHDQINNSFHPDSLTPHQETFSLPTATNFHKPARENRNPAAGDGVICHKPGQGRHNSGCRKFAVDTPFVSC